METQRVAAVSMATMDVAAADVTPLNQIRDVFGDMPHTS